MPFINGVWLEPTVPQIEYPGKIKVTRSSVSLQFALARRVEGTYKVEFIVNIHPNVMVDPTKNLRPSMVDMQSLKIAIIGSIREYDRKYMQLKHFTTQKAVFYYPFQDTSFFFLILGKQFYNPDFSLLFVTFSYIMGQMHIDMNHIAIQDNQ